MIYVLILNSPCFVDSRGQVLILSPLGMAVRGSGSDTVHALYHGAGGAAKRGFYSSSSQFISYLEIRNVSLLQ
jgi:hypothetical protein